MDLRLLSRSVAAMAVAVDSMAEVGSVVVVSTVEEGASMEAVDSVDFMEAEASEVVAGFTAGADSAAAVSAVAGFVVEQAFAVAVSAAKASGAAFVVITSAVAGADAAGADAVGAGEDGAGVDGIGMIGDGASVLAGRIGVIPTDITILGGRPTTVLTTTLIRTKTLMMTPTTLLLTTLLLTGIATTGIQIISIQTTGTSILFRQTLLRDPSTGHRTTTGLQRLRRGI